MSDVTAFRPLYTTTSPTLAGTLQPSITVAASTANANSAAFPGQLYQSNASIQIEIANQTAAWAYVNFGVFGSVAAATVAGSYPIAPGGNKVVTVNPEISGASVILAAGAAAGSVTFTRGEGL